MEEAYNIIANMGTGVNETGYRYDIEYFNTIQEYFISITGKRYNQTNLLVNLLVNLLARYNVITIQCSKT